MAFTIPSSDEAATPAIQSQVFETDLSILVAAYGGVGVVSGCAVSAQGSPNMTVAVAAGVIVTGGTLVTVAANSSLSINTADGSNPRIDLISVSAAGTITYNAGTAASTASVKPPDLTAGHIGLAFVHVPAADTTIASNQIVDKRVVIALPHGFIYSYVEYTSEVSITATTEGTAQTVVTAAAITTDGSESIQIEFFAPYATTGTSAGNNIVTQVNEGSTVLGFITGLRAVAGVSGGMVNTCNGFRKLTPSAGSHTYSIRSYLAAGTTGNIGAGTGGTGQYVPGFVRITKA